MQCHLVWSGIIYVNFAMPPWLASHLICELYHAIIFYYVLNLSKKLYIQLLFLCISHLAQSWKYLEWKQGLQSRQCYLTKHMPSWLRVAPQRRIQRQMTSPIPPRGVCSNLAGLCCSCRAYGVSHCYVI